MALRRIPAAIVAMVLTGASVAVPRARQGAQPAADDGKRELTISGCLLRSGYAGYQIEEARLEAIDGKPLEQPADSSSTSPAAPKKWILDGGGNLGPRAGEKVQVVGRSEWQPRSASTSPADEPERTPHIDVKSVKTLAASCT